MKDDMPKPKREQRYELDEDHVDTNRDRLSDIIVVVLCAIGCGAIIWVAGVLA